MLRRHGHRSPVLRSRVFPSPLTVQRNSLMGLTRPSRQDAASDARRGNSGHSNPSRDPAGLSSDPLSTGTPSTAPRTTISSPEAPFVWRQHLSKEQLLRIDYVMYSLRKYPVVGTRARQAAPPSTHTSNSKESSSLKAEVKTSPPRTKKKRRQEVLQALSKHRQLQQTRAPAATPARHQFTGDVAPEQIHPLHPLSDVLVYERRLLAQQPPADAEAERTARQREEARCEADAALLVHPHDLFANEEMVFQRFGMHTAGTTSADGTANPVDGSQEGFHGLFRQRWQDFCVTEMEVCLDEGPRPAGAAPTPSPVPLRKRRNRTVMCSDAVQLPGARCVPRTYDYAVPDLPDYFYHTGGTTHAAAATEEETDAPDASFFEVNTSDRVKAMLSEVEADLLRYQKTPPALCEATAAPPVGAEAPAGPPPTRTQQLLASLATLEAREARLRAIAEDHPDITTAGLRCLLAPGAAAAAPAADGDADGAPRRRRDYYLQCTLHKQHVAHGTAVSVLSQTLRLHPSDISFAGIKDFLGDTVQRVRLKNVSPQAALEANRQLTHKLHFDHGHGAAAAAAETAEAAPGDADDAFEPTTPTRKKLYGHVSLSNFCYETAPLFPGDLYGNFFDVVLRDVTAPVAHVEERLAAFVRDGFPNYYGCQRFSWFAGGEDAAVALLHHNFLVFAFRFLNFTSEDFSLRELLQRPWLYPHPVQDAYRRHVVRRLRQVGIEPPDLDVHPFLSCPSLHDPLTSHAADGAGARPLNVRQQLIVWQLQEAYFDLEPQSRRLTAQRQSSYLWNQVLTLRNHHFSTAGGGEVLVGDLVLPAAWRRLQGRSVQDRQRVDLGGDAGGGEAPLARASNCVLVTEANRHRFTIEDVVHPGFSFGDHALPHNVVGRYYEQVCNKYHLSWSRPTGDGPEAARDRQGRVLKEFYEPPRPIRRFPQQLTYRYDTAAHTLQLHFALERGCYANVAVTELLRLQQCAGSEVVRRLPVPGGATAWRALHGGVDRGYVEAVQDIYKDFEDGVGFVGGRRSE
ncbi:pseudouridylate synthase, partial [Strigomonas culicis]